MGDRNMNEQTHKRKKLLIDRPLQLKFFTNNSLFLFIFALMIGGSIYLSMWYSITREFSSFRLNEQLHTIGRLGNDAGSGIETLPFVKQQAQMLSIRQKEILNNILLRANLSLIPVMIVLIVIVFAVSLVFSHRIAGPVYRMKKSLRAVREGNLSQSFTLRGKDELKELAGEMAGTVRDWALTVDEIRSQVTAIKNTTSLQKISGHVERIEGLLGKYSSK